MTLNSFSAARDDSTFFCKCQSQESDWPFLGHRDIHHFFCHSLQMPTNWRQTETKHIFARVLETRQLLKSESFKCHVSENLELDRLIGH